MARAIRRLAHIRATSRPWGAEHHALVPPPLRSRIRHALVAATICRCRKTGSRFRRPSSIPTDCRRRRSSYPLHPNDERMMDFAVERALDLAKAVGCLRRESQPLTVPDAAMRRQHGTCSAPAGSARSRAIRWSTNGVRAGTCRISTSWTAAFFPPAAQSTRPARSGRWLCVLQATCGTDSPPPAPNGTRFRNDPAGPSWVWRTEFKMSRPAKPW